MSVSLPAAAISFDLYSACPFESVDFSGPQLDENEGVQFDDSALSGPAVAPPAYEGVANPYLSRRYPASFRVRSDFEFESFDSLDAIDCMPSGSHRPMSVSCAGTPYAFFQSSANAYYRI